MIKDGFLRPRKGETESTDTDDLSALIVSGKYLSRTEIFLEFNSQKAIDILQEDGLIEETDDEKAKELLESPEGAKKVLEAVKKKDEEQAAVAATLDLSEFTGMLGQDATEEMKAFLKRAEQCFLLGSLRVFGLLGEKNRIDDFVAEGAPAHPEAAKKGISIYPYGGRVYPIKCDTGSGTNAQYVNLLNSDSDIYSFTANYSKDVNNALRHNFMFYKVESMPDGSVVEKPLLFGPSQDPNDSRLNNPQPDGVLISKDGKSTKVTPSLETEVLMGSSLSSARGEILIKSINIKFKGETTATARSNVDVKVEIEMNDISFLQAQFKAITYKEARTGPPKPISYKYSLLDFITYSFNSTASSVIKKLRKGQARIFSPKFHRNHNRMLLKIAHTEIADKVSSTKTKTALKLDTLANEGKISKKAVEEIRKHLASSNLVLDLALVDHTIKKDPVTQKATITIDYKGFTKTFMNSPFLDISRTQKDHKTIKDQEKKLIEKLAKTTNIGIAKREISVHNKKIENLNKAYLEAGVNEIIKNLRKRRKVFRTFYSSNAVFGQNVTADGLEIYSPEKINDYFQGQIKKGFIFVLTPSGVKPINSTEITEGIDALDGDTETPEDRAGAEVLLEDNTAAYLDFFYFGDLCDAILDNFYNYNDPYVGDGTTPVSVQTINRKPESVKPDFRNIPIKISLPTWRPLVAKGGKDLDLTPPTEEEVDVFKVEAAVEALGASTGTAGTGTNFEPYTKDLSLADFPIAMNTFVKWWDKNVKERGGAFLSVGAFIAKFINDVINSSLLETCYQNGYGEVVQYGVKMDYGLFGKTEKNNLSYKDSSKTWWSDTPTVGGFYKLQKKDSPFIKKPATSKISDMCNFIVVYPQTIPFSEAKKLRNEPDNHRKNNIPKFQLYKKVDDNYRVKDQFDVGEPKGIINRSIQFNKVENSKYLREFRYDVEGLSSLSQISSVYNATVTCFPVFSMFPGMLFYADAGLYQSSEDYGSIAHILGLGGYHVTTAVTHNLKINEQGEIIEPRTSIEGVWTFTGEVRGAPVKTESETGEKEKESPPPTEDGRDAEETSSKKSEEKVVDKGKEEVGKPKDESDEPPVDVPEGEPKEKTTSPRGKPKEKTKERPILNM